MSSVRTRCLVLILTLKSLTNIKNYPILIAEEPHVRQRIENHQLNASQLDASSHQHVRKCLALMLFLMQLI